MGMAMEDGEKLRSLAAWYREFADKAANPVIWESRLRTAEDLEAEAVRLDRRQSAVIANHSLLPPLQPKRRSPKSAPSRGDASDAPLTAAISSTRMTGSEPPKRLTPMR